MTGGSHYFEVAPTGAADSAITWTTALTIDSYGAGVISGVPTTNIPIAIRKDHDSQTYLQVRNDSGGTSAISGIGASYNSWGRYVMMAQLSPNYAGSGLFLADASVIWATGGANGLIIGAVGVTPLRFGTNNTIHFTINSEGNHGFNTQDIEAWHGSYGAIEMGIGNSLMYEKGGPNFSFSTNYYYDGVEKRKIASYAARYSQNEGHHYFRVASTGAADSEITWITALTIGPTGGVHVGGTTDPGNDNLLVDGTLHVDGVATLDGHATFNSTWTPPAGTVVQVVNVQSGAVASGTTIMPNDDSIPQNDEGDEYMTLAITPKSATNKLLITVNAIGSNDQNNIVTGALFQDTTAGALCAGFFGGYSTSKILFTMQYYMVAGTTSATTFKFRAGPAAAATFTFNGSGGNRLLGTAPKSSITIMEIQG